MTELNEMLAQYTSAQKTVDKLRQNCQRALLDRLNEAHTRLPLIAESIAAKIGSDDSDLKQINQDLDTILSIGSKYLGENEEPQQYSEKARRSPKENAGLRLAVRKSIDKYPRVHIFQSHTIAQELGIKNKSVGSYIKSNRHRWVEQEEWTLEKLDNRNSYGNYWLKTPKQPTNAETVKIYALKNLISNPKSEISYKEIKKATGASIPCIRTTIGNDSSYRAKDGIVTATDEFIKELNL